MRGAEGRGGVALASFESETRRNRFVFVSRPASFIASSAVLFTFVLFTPLRTLHTLHTLRATATATAFAFAFAPPRVDVLVSDVVAYPERVVALVEDWCGARRCDLAVVTMKFRGDAPDFGALDAALRAAEDRGYAARAKHFFSNKNEATLMLKRRT